MRKTVWILCFMLLLAAVPAQASGAAMTMELQVDAAGEAARIAGKHPLGAEKRVTVLVLGPSGQIHYLDQTESESDGSYLFVVSLASAENGRYEVRVGGEGAQAVTKHFLYENEETPGEPDDPAEPGTPDDPGEPDTPGEPGRPGKPVIPAETPSDDDGETIIRLKPVLKDGTAAAGMSEEEYNGLLSKIKAGLVKEAVLAVEKADGAREYRIEFFSGLLHNALELLTVRTPFAVLAIGGDALYGLSGRETITLSIKQVDVSSLPAAAAAQLQGKIVYDFVLEAGGQPIRAFNGQKSVMVAIPYERKPGERPETIVAYYVDEKGNRLQVIRNSRYETEAQWVRFYPEHLSVYAAGAAEAAFSDIASVEWAHESIYGLAARGIVQGYGNNEFRPFNSITRAEFVKMLIHAFDLLLPAAEAEFADVPRGIWYYAEAAAAAKLGIAAGYPDGTFGGERPITRQEMAVMAVRAMRAAGLHAAPAGAWTALRDLDEVAGYAKEAIETLNRAGIIEGDEAGLFRPADPATRAEAAKVLYMIWKLAD